MKPAKPLTLALAFLPALAQAHPGHPAPPGHEHMIAFLDSPALGLLAGLGVVVVLIAARLIPRRARTTATRRR